MLPKSQVYVVCVWYETSHGKRIWRASIRNDLTGQRIYFADPALLIDFISQIQTGTSGQA